MTTRARQRSTSSAWTQTVSSLIKYQFTFPNIHFAINCDNPVRFLSEDSQCSTQRSDLTIISLSGMT